MSFERKDLYDDSVTVELARHCREIIRLLGEDEDREGLVDTPVRVAKALQFLTHGYSQDPVAILRSALFKEKYDQMVIVKDIDLHSLCEHHMMPFQGKCHVAYFPDGQIVGISKIARVVECYARRLQVQERLTNQISECIQEALCPNGVAVVIEAEHTCMSMRGVQKAQALTVTSSYTGRFSNDENARKEFLKQIGL